jgi:hypothetical protein
LQIDRDILREFALLDEPLDEVHTPLFLFVGPIARCIVKLFKQLLSRRGIFSSDQ